MSKAALSILSHIIRDKPTRENRMTELLKDPSAETAEGWYMCVPSCFNDALDIKQTERVDGKKKALVWTQGSSFFFKPGDVLYDTSDAYTIWNKALTSIGICVQIKAGSSAGSTEGATGRSSGSITFSVLLPMPDKSKLIEHAEHTMTQDDFVRFLIEGPTGELQKKIEKP